MAEAGKTLERLNTAWKEAVPQLRQRIKEKHDFFYEVMRYARQTKEHLAEHHEDLDEELYENALRMLRNFTEEMNSFLERVEEEKNA